MKARKYILLALSLSIASCTAGPEPFVEPATATSTVMQAATSTATFAPTDTPVPPASQTTSPPSFELIGHSPLLARGMKAGLAVYGNYAYVGSRTDGSHPDAG